MPALSKKQQKFMGIVRSIQKGEQPASKFNKDAQDVAKDMKKTDVKKYASTKHKGLPMKKEMFSKINKMIKQELKEYTYGVGDVVKDVNPSCPHYGAEGKVKSVSPRSVVFIVKNKGDNFKPGQELEKTHDQMKKTNEALSPKAKPLARGLSKSQKDTLEMMIDMQGLDQVMSDFKRDKKAFKQALADMSENINEKKKMFPPKKMTPKQAKEYKKFIGYAKMGIEYQIDMSLFESVNEDGHTDVASAKRKAMLVVDDANKLLNKLNGMNKEDSLPSWLSDKITIAQTNLSKSSDYLNNPVESVNEKFEMPDNEKRQLKTVIKSFNSKKKEFFGLNSSIVIMAKVLKKNKFTGTARELMNALVALRKAVENVESQHMEESINEARLDPKQLLQQLGGNKFVAMTGAKNLAVDKSKNELHMKIGRNSKSISHVIIRLSSMDLYDMEFLSIRGSSRKIKSKEKGVYADQLGKMFKKNTGLDVRL